MFVNIAELFVKNIEPTSTKGIISKAAYKTLVLLSPNLTARVIFLFCKSFSLSLRLFVTNIAAANKPIEIANIRKYGLKNSV